jgi:hypothetical protein
VLAHQEDAARRQPSGDPGENDALQRVGKIGEDQIAAQDEVKGTRGKLTSNVLCGKPNPV